MGSCLPSRSESATRSCSRSVGALSVGRSSLSIANSNQSRKPVKSASAPETPLCPLCQSLMILRTTQKFRYPNGDPRKFWSCSTWPKCNGIHGAHPDGRPLGIPGDAETKKARIRAHDAFDAVWRGRKWSRSHGYRWLREQLEITKTECHIGNFDVETCERVISLCALEKEPVPVKK